MVLFFKPLLTCSKCVGEIIKLPNNITAISCRAPCIQFWVHVAMCFGMYYNYNNYYDYNQNTLLGKTHYFNKIIELLHAVS